MNVYLLTKTELFRGITFEEAKAMLACLEAKTKQYQKGEYIYRAGDFVRAMGLVLSGSVHVEHDDVWGNKSILDNIGVGQVFAETYSCLPEEPLMIHVIAAEKTDVLFLDMDKLLNTCQSSCRFHSRLIQNLLSVTARKNLILTRKIFHTAPKSIRGKLLSYFSSQAILQGKYQFEIPFNRQQLADYLGVDRSALSSELSKMKQEGLLSFEKNKFSLHTALVD